MNEQQQAAYVQAMAAAALIEALGMVAENQKRAGCGLSPAYDEVAFNGLIGRYGIHQNALLSFFGGGG